MFAFVSDNRDPAARAIAAYLASVGHEVALNDLGGEAVPGVETVRVKTDDAAALRAFFASREPGGVIAVAPPPVYASVEAATDEQWDAAFCAGALSSLMLAQAACERMAALGRGTMIFLGSIHCEKPLGHGFLYSMACASTQMLAREAALDYGGKGLKSVYVQRGPETGDAWPESDVTNVHAGVAHRFPAETVPAPDELGGLIAFLLTDAAKPLNGDDLRADGGYVMYYGKQKAEARS